MRSSGMRYRSGPLRTRSLPFLGAAFGRQVAQARPVTRGPQPAFGDNPLKAHTAEEGVNRATVWCSRYLG